MRNQFILEILARNLDSKPIYRLIACEISNKTDASQIPQLPPAPESPTQLFKQVVRYYIAGRPFTRDKVIQSHSVYRNSYITSSYDDAPMQFFKLVVRHYYLAGRPFTRDGIVQTHSVHPNSYITCSYDDAPTQLFKPVVKHCHIVGRLITRDKIV